MRQGRGGNYNFDWARMTNYLGDTGPFVSLRPHLRRADLLSRYLQYAHVRLCSIVRKTSAEVNLPAADQIHTISTDLLSEPKAREVLLILASYPEAVKMAFRVSEPSTIVTFCWRLTHAISSAYEVLIVRGQPTDVATARLLLYVSARDVLSSAMRLLTLTPLERM